MSEVLEQMCCHVRMGFRASSPHRRFPAALIVVAALGLGLAVGPPAVASEVAKQPKMKIGFVGRTARLAGPGALVDVRCMGTVASSCVGTLTLRGPDGAHEVPYSIERGERRILVVPLGSEDDAVERIANAQAVADTMQASGSSVRTACVLRIG